MSLKRTPRPHEMKRLMRDYMHELAVNAVLFGHCACGWSACFGPESSLELANIARIRESAATYRLRCPECGSTLVFKANNAFVRTRSTPTQP